MNQKTKNQNKNKKKEVRVMRKWLIPLILVGIIVVVVLVGENIIPNHWLIKPAPTEVIPQPDTTKQTALPETFLQYPEWTVMPDTFEFCPPDSVGIISLHELTVLRNDLMIANGWIQAPKAGKCDLILCFLPDTAVVRELIANFPQFKSGGMIQFSYGGGNKVRFEIDIDWMRFLLRESGKESYIELNLPAQIFIKSSTPLTKADPSGPASLF
jgi:hypothetical protein